MLRLRVTFPDRTTSIIPDRFLIHILRDRYRFHLKDQSDLDVMNIFEREILSTYLNYEREPSEQFTEMFLHHCRTSEPFKYSVMDLSVEILPAEVINDSK